MTDTTETKEVNAREALKCIRGSMSNGEVMAKFKISPAGYADLLRQLYEHNLITEDDLKRRGIAYKSQKKADAGAERPVPVQAVPAEQITQAPPAESADEGFLDTLALTEMLARNPADELDDEPEADKPSSPEEPDEETKKKGKFGLKGFFKKKR
jgi:hypothetical protein